MMLYPAKAALKIVTMIDGMKEIVVPDCQILGEGMAPESTGILVADGTNFCIL